MLTIETISTVEERWSALNRLEREEANWRLRKQKKLCHRTSWRKEEGKFTRPNEWLTADVSNIYRTSINYSLLLLHAASCKARLAASLIVSLSGQTLSRPSPGKKFVTHKHLSRSLFTLFFCREDRRKPSTAHARFAILSPSPLLAATDHAEESMSRPQCLLRCHRIIFAYFNNRTTEQGLGKPNTFNGIPELHVSTLSLTPPGQKFSDNLLCIRLSIRSWLVGAF